MSQYQNQALHKLPTMDKFQAFGKNIRLASVNKPVPFRMRAVYTDALQCHLLPVRSPDSAVCEGTAGKSRCQSIDPTVPTPPLLIRWQTQLPADYIELEKRVDALKTVHQKLLAVT